MEAMLVAAVTAMVSFIMIYFSNDCQPLGPDQAEDYPLQVHKCAQARTQLQLNPTMFLPRIFYFIFQFFNYFFLLYFCSCTVQTVNTTPWRPLSSTHRRGVCETSFTIRQVRRLGWTQTFASRHNLPVARTIVLLQCMLVFWLWAKICYRRQLITWSGLYVVLKKTYNLFNPYCG